MNKKLIPLIGIGALAGSAAWLLAKKHLKKPEPSEFDFEDDPLLDYSDPDFREIDTYSRIYPGSDKKSCGHIMNYELRDALRLLFSTYSDEEIAEYSVCLGETDVDLREYWVNTIAGGVVPTLRHMARTASIWLESMARSSTHRHVFSSAISLTVSTTASVPWSTIFSYGSPMKASLPSSQCSASCAGRWFSVTMI